MRTPGSPQGTMAEKYDRSGFTFRAKPCRVTQRRTPMPMEAILSAPTHTPVRPSPPRGGNIPGGQRGDDHVFEPTQIAVDIFAVSFQVQNGIADHLAGSMKRDLPAATDPVDRHLTGVEQVARVASPAQG